MSELDKTHSVKPHILPSSFSEKLPRLEDMCEIEEIRQRHGVTTSAHAFVSILTWRAEYSLSLIVSEDFYTVRFKKRGENSFFFPVGSEAKKREFLEWGLTAPNFLLSYLRAEDKAFLESAFPNRYTINAQDGDSEYIYETRALAQHQGGNYRKLRGKLNALLHSADPIEAPIINNCICYGCTPPEFGWLRLILE